MVLVIWGLVFGYIGDSNKCEFLMKEVVIGLLNGIIWVLIIGVIVVVWKGEWMFGGIIFVVMMINFIVAGIVGVSIFILLKKMNIDFVFAGGMVLIIVMDVIGLFVFFGLVILLLVS